MSELFLNVVNMSLSASIVMLAVLALRLLLKGAPKKWSYLLWSVVGFRLCCPVSVRAVFSLFRALPARLPAAEVAAPASVPASAMEYVPRNIAYMSRPQVNVGVLAVNNVVNGSLPAATPQASMNPMQFWIFLAALIWVAGMAVLLVVSLWNYFKTHRLVLDAVRTERGVYETDAISSPFILGFFRPVIYLPLGLNGERRRYVLEHERYHLKRKDHLTRLFAFLLLAIHWFNPLVWLGYYLMGKDMEMSCDEAVLGMEEGREKEYSATLLSFAVAGRFPGLLAFGEASVKSRIRNALNWRRPRTWVSLVAGLLCVALVVSCAVNPSIESPNVSPMDQILEGLPEDSAASPWSVTLTASDVTPRGLTLTISQSGGDATGRLQTGSFFVVERWSGSAWEALDPLPTPSGVTRAWTTEGRLIEKNTSQTGKVNWMDLYGELPGGRYRIGKSIMDFRKPGDFDEQMAYALFQIEEGAYIPAMMQIPIPEEYGGLVEVESTVDRVSVYEKKSREDFRADFEKDPWPDYDHPDQVGMGWLCSISRVDADAAREIREMDSGGTIFAEDGKGAYYAFLYPTDVRLYRTGGDISRDADLWTELNEWARTVPGLFLTQHPDLIAWATPTEGKTAVFDIFAFGTLPELLSHLQAEDIGHISAYGMAQGPSAEAVAPLLRRAPDFAVDHPGLTLNGSDTDVVWDLTLYLGGSLTGGWSGDDALHLQAGIEEGIVEIFGGKNLPQGRLVVNDKALYWILRDTYVVPDQVDRAAYLKYHEPVVSVYNGRLADYQKVWPKINGWTLMQFELAGERPDLGIVAYQMDAALIGAPQDIIHTGAGGAYVDGELRLVGIDWKYCYLAVVDGESAGAFYTESPLNMEQFATRQEFLNFLANNRNAGG